MNLSRFFWILYIGLICVQYSPMHAMESIVGGRFNALVENDPIEEIHEKFVKLMGHAPVDVPQYDERTTQWFKDPEIAYKQNSQQIFMIQDKNERIARHQMPLPIDQIFRALAVVVPWVTIKKNGLTGASKNKVKIPKSTMAIEDIIYSEENRYYIPGSIHLADGRELPCYHEFTITPDKLETHRCSKSPSSAEQKNPKKYSPNVINAKNTHKKSYSVLDPNTISETSKLVTCTMKGQSNTITHNYDICLKKSADTQAPLPIIKITPLEGNGVTYTLNTSYLTANDLIN